MNTKSYLNQPHPKFFKNWALIIAISLFIGFFIFLLKPFGLFYLKHPYKDLILFGYGFITFIMLSFNLILLQKIFSNFFDERNWTVLKQIIWLTWIIFTIGIGNYMYSKILFSLPWEGWRGFLIFQLFTLFIGLIPVTILTIVKQNRLLTQYLKLANELNEKLQSLPASQNINADEIITLIAENEKDKIVLKIGDLLYIESVGNYAEVHYLIEQNLKKSILRSSLKKLENDLKDFDELLRCHRAFIVNIKKIKKATGNSQGYRLRLENTDFEIPVSRNYTKSLKEKLN